ncbi:MAG: hypothetical protein R3Y38_06855 [Rikenellaceae bacterium]
MKLKDLAFLLGIFIILSPFIFCDYCYAGYVSFNASHPYVMAFIKFAILSTIGEASGLRVKTGNYTQPNFGVFPRFILWGLFGVWIAVAMKSFASGVPVMVESLGIDGAVASMKGPLTLTRVFTAFMISVMMNTIFAPVFMTLHKITDAHILKNGGKAISLFRPINMAQGFRDVNWDVQWGFVFKKTIPLFWFPAHTITFLLPGEFQVLFAALLSVALGLILSVAAVMSRKS